MHCYDRLASVSLLILLAACSSSSGSGTLPSPSPPGPGTTVNVTFSGTLPNAAAVSTASGIFISSSLSGNRLSLVVPAGTNTYAFAVACPAVNAVQARFAEYVFEANLSDGASYNVAPCIASVAATGSAIGTFDISAIAGAVKARIVGAQGYSGDVNGVTGAFNVAMPTGTNDVAVLALDGFGNVLAVKILRGQAVPGAVNAGATVIVSTADEVTNEAVTVNGVPSGFQPTLNAVYLTANSTTIGLNGVSGTYSAISPANTGAFDQFQINSNATNSALSEALGTTLFSITGAPVTLNYPSLWIYTPPAAAQFPTFSYTYTGFSALATQTYRAQIAWQSGPGAVSQIGVFATGASLGTQTSIAIPNLAALPGFFKSASSGSLVTWVSRIDGGTFPSYVYPPPVPGSLSFVQAYGTYIEP